MGQKVRWNMKRIKDVIKIINEDENSNNLGLEIEKNEYALDLINSWINNADTKISISCGLSTFVLAVIVFEIENFLSKLDTAGGFDCCILNGAKFVAIIASILFLCALWFHFGALNPNLTSPSPQTDKKNGLFFCDISRFESVIGYINYTRSRSDERFNEELLEEIFVNSRICTKKMNRFKIGMWLSLGAILFVIFAGILYYLSIIPAA